MYELEVPISKNNDAIVKDYNKCIKCGYCKKVCVDEIISSKLLEERPDAEPLCINCGQCSNICPTEAIHEKFDYLKVKKILKDKNNKKVIFSVAPAVRVALGEDLGLEVGINLEKKIPSLLKSLGADYVFDITFGADLTIMEEAMEFVTRLKNNTRIPQFTSCCPAWVKYLEIFYPSLLNNLSTTKSPIAIQSSIIKTYFAQKIDTNPQDIINVVVAPCTAKKSEINRNELNVTTKDTDYILTTRELALLIKEENINVYDIGDSNFDSPLKTGSGAGVIFGSSGGVCEAALRTAYYFLTNKNLKKEELEFTSLRGIKGIKEANVDINGRKIKVAVCNGIRNARILIDKLLKEEVHYDFVEVMNCTGGCIAGGGQPKSTMLYMAETKEARSNALYDEDKKMNLRLCHENPEIKFIYEEFLDKPNSELAKKLLHTTYEDKSYLLRGDKHE
ncbi:MAG: hydrogenase [Firmicutes bacterium]|nr:hydrogenase [Bacillota bacterium]